MSFSHADLDAVERAIATGVQSVTYADRTVTYRSTRELMLLRDRMQRELAGASPSRTTIAGFRTR